MRLSTRNEKTMNSANTRSVVLSRTVIALAIAVSLSACGGGGGNTKSDAPTAGTPVTPVTPPKMCDAKNATNYGKGTVCAYTYNNVHHTNRVATGAAEAVDRRGLTGAGVKVALLDTGSPSNTSDLTGYAPLEGKVSGYKDFVTTSAPDDQLTISIGVGHGSYMASLINGKPITYDVTSPEYGTSTHYYYQGGIAQGVDLYWGRVCETAKSCSSNAITEGLKYFADQGVRIFNLSLGSTYSVSSANAFLSMAETAYKADALVVAATGNSGESEPVNPSALPVFYGKYADNWLAVGNVLLKAQVDRKDGDSFIGDLDSTSNWCGSAKDFCLVAPGNSLVILEQNNTVGAYVRGTSVSTALVSGAAAIVSEAYPWMSASNLQQTLLTTATDIGDAGVDEKFGWGMVNVNKAVEGPAQFTKDFSANVTSGYNSSFTNDISGGGGLVKSGAGRLDLTGSNSYKGLTDVQGGALGVSNRIVGDVSVASGASLLTSGNASIGGSLSLVDGSTLGVEMGSPLTVSGAMRADGTLYFSGVKTGYTPNSESVLSVVKAGSVNGTFDQVTYANNLFWSASLNYTATDISAELTKTSSSSSAQSLGLTQVVVDGGAQADTAIGSLDTTGITSDNEVFSIGLVRVMNSDNATAAASLSTLTGAVLGSARAAEVASDMNALRTIADHVAVSDKTERNVWGQVDSSEGAVRRTGYATSDWDRSGTTAGVDIPMDSATIGFVGNVSDLRVNAHGDRVKADQTSVYAWGHKEFADVYLTGLVGATRSKVDGSRSVLSGSVLDTVAFDRKDTSVQARIEAGYKVGAVVPFAAVGAVRNTQGSFTENNALGLTARSNSATASFVEVGARANGSTGNWFYNGAVVYRNVLTGRNLNYTAAFAGLNDTTFDVQAPGVDRERFRAVLGGGYSFNDAWKVYGQVSTETGSGQGPVNAAELGLR